MYQMQLKWMCVIFALYAIADAVAFIFCAKLHFAHIFGSFLLISMLMNAVSLFATTIRTYKMYEDHTIPW